MKRRAFLRGVGTIAGGLAMGGGRGRAQEPVPLPDAASPDYWPAVRRLFRLPADFAYLNTAGLGSSPVSVEAVLASRTELEDENPAPGHDEDDFARVRARLAALLGPGCHADEIALVSTATEGINAILNAVPLTAGDEIITSTHEHAGLTIPLLHKIQTHGVVVRTFEPDLERAAGNVDRMARMLSSRTRLIFVSHVTCTTGQVMPVAAIGALASSAGATFALDGAQSLAHVPFDIAATGAHYYAASCHKWLLGPKRTGLLFVRRDRCATATPSIVGAYSDRESAFADRRLVLRPNAQRFEYGTQNDALVYGVEAAAVARERMGGQAIWDHNRSLAERFVRGLAAVPGAHLLSPADPAARSAIVSCRIGGRDNRAVASELVRRRLRVRSVTEAGLDAVRASFHVYNSEAEVDRLTEALREIAAQPPARNRP
jgi:selenocysteine lyase/cysteine desulfurase